MTQVKIELVKETDVFNNEVWYSIYVDGSYKTGSTNQHKIEKLYYEVISDPSLLQKRKEILHYAEIILSL